MTSALRVSHVDHTTANGGAEYALVRMLTADPTWTARLFLPHSHEAGLGVYSSLETTPAVEIERVGPAQESGASSAGLTEQLRFAARAIGQSLALGTNRDFRASHVVHTNTSRAAVYAAVACWLSRKPLVVHLRDTVDEVSLGRVGFLLFSKIALKRATGVIANSQATLASARPFLRPTAMTTVIPSASGISKAAVSSTAAGAILRVGMVARIDPWKGQDLLLRAFAAVFADTETRLVLAGEAAFGHEDYLETLRHLAAELGIDGQIDFLGHVDNVAGLLPTLDICVQASRRPEPLGQNVLQYLASGRVVIATDAGGPAEWIRHDHNGVLFEIGDEVSLAEQLGRVAADPALRGNLARAAVETPGLLSDVEVMREHESFFRQCAELIVNRTKR